MIVTISGRPGSGKSTVGQMLAKRLKYRYFDVGKIRRAMARKRGLTLAEYNKLGESDPSTDIEVDEYQRNLGKDKDNFVLVSRLGYHFVPHSKRVFLSVNSREAAKRILNDASRGPEEKAETLTQALKHISARNVSDLLRYKKYYQLNPFNKSNYDFVIDTSSKTPAQIVRLLISRLND